MNTIIIVIATLPIAIICGLGCAVAIGLLEEKSG